MSTTIEFAINKAKDKRQFEARLKSEIKLLESKLDNGEDVYEIYNTLKKNWNKLKKKLPGEALLDPERNG